MRFALSPGCKIDCIIILAYTARDEYEEGRQDHIVSPYLVSLPSKLIILSAVALSKNHICLGELSHRKSKGELDRLRCRDALAFSTVHTSGTKSHMHLLCSHSQSIWYLRVCHRSVLFLFRTDSK